MAIGTSNGQTYEDEFEQVKASFESPVTSSTPPTMPPTAPTELLDELKPDGYTQVAGRDWDVRPTPTLPILEDKYKLFPTVPSITPGRNQREPLPPAKPGERLSDADHEQWIAGQHYAADIHGRGSDMSGPYMHQPTYSEEHKKSLDRRASILKGADPSFWDGDADFRRNNLRELLDKSQEERDADHQKFLEDWNSAPNTQKIDPKNYPSPEAGIFRIWKNVKGIEEFLKDLPDDVEAFDMDDGTVVIKKKAALTSQSDEQPYEIKAGQQYAMDVSQYKDMPAWAIKELEADREKARRMEQKIQKSLDDTEHQLRLDKIESKMPPKARIQYHDAIRKLEQRELREKPR